MDKLTNSLKRDLILSVGTHKKNRPLSPVEVAEGFKVAIDNGMSRKELAELVQFGGTSMIDRFLNLLKLNKDLRYLVDWRQGDLSISFSSASKIACLTDYEQKEVVKAILDNRLNKDEITQIIQIKKRSNKDINNCIQEVLNQRPTIERRYIFIGKIINPELSKSLERLTQLERNALLKKTINSEVNPNIHSEVRLGMNGFSLLGDELLSNELKKLKPDFESCINNLLNSGVKNV
jgi:hypothetical protein